jgi:hypothetical protein
MDQTLSQKMLIRESVALVEETVRLIGKVVGELGQQIVEWKRLANPASPLVSPATEERRYDTEQDW